MKKLIVKRYMLSKREKRKILETIENLTGIKFDKHVDVEYVELKDASSIYVVEGIPALITTKDLCLPHLKLIVRYKDQVRTPRVVVDAGAIKPIINGADVMAPGIVEVIGEFDAGATIIVVDEKNRFPIAVGRSLVSRQELLSMMLARRGRAIENMHHIGDKWWKVGEDVSS